MKVVSTFVDEAQLNRIFCQIDETYPEMSFFESKVYKQTFPHLIKQPAQEAKNSGAKGKKGAAKNAGKRKTADKAQAKQDQDDDKIEVSSDEAEFEEAKGKDGDQE